MDNINTEQRPWFFNLNKDNDEAIVRLLHSSPKTIESALTHSITVGDKKKRIRCNGGDCLLCADGNEVSSRIYIHLWDYTDNKEKVWDRTEKILPQLEELFEAWNPLHSAVVKIKRIGNEFPKYDITPMNPAGYAEVDKNLIDQQLAYRYSMKRSNNEIQTFLETGTFPERKPFVPKEEYFKQKQNQSEKPANGNDPFADSIISKPRKV